MRRGYNNRSAQSFLQHRSRSQNPLKSIKSVHGSFLVSQTGQRSLTPVPLTADSLLTTFQSVSSLFRTAKTDLVRVKQDVLEMKADVNAFRTIQDMNVEGWRTDLGSDLQTNIALLAQGITRENELTNDLTMEVKSLNAEIRHFRRMIHDSVRTMDNLEAFVGVKPTQKRR